MISTDYRRSFKNATAPNDPLVVDGRGYVGVTSWRDVAKYPERGAIRWAAAAFSEKIKEMKAEWDGPMEHRDGFNWFPVSQELQVVCDEIHAKVMG